eukprot:2407706-Karenia_brevis.AAC.1
MDIGNPGLEAFPHLYGDGVALGWYSHGPQLMAMVCLLDVLALFTWQSNRSIQSVEMVGLFFFQIQSCLVQNQINAGSNGNDQWWS